MASDKFGSNPVAPLYNVTGRNPRDITPSATGQPLGSVGSSGSGGKNFGISNQAPQVGGQNTNSNFGIFSPYNYFSPFGRRNTRNRIRGMLGGGLGNSSTSNGANSLSQPQGQGQPQGMSQTTSMSDDGTTQTNTFNNPGGGAINFNPSMTGLDFSVNKGATAGGDINNATGADVANQYNQKVDINGSAPSSNPTKAKRAPRTDAQKAQRLTTDRARAATRKANPSATKTSRAPKNNQSTPGAGGFPVTIINGKSNRVTK